MKQLLYMLIGILMYPVLADISELMDDKLNTNAWTTVGIPSYGLALGLTGRCSNHIRPNGISNREYFKCGNINILISNTLYKEGNHE